jgi:drug/metabolite transporter (DMT)-like permease
VWLSIICLALFSTALAYILFFRILESAGATNVVLVTFLAPITATFLGWLVLDEQLHSRYFLGMAIIGLGLAAIDGRLWAKLRATGKKI